MNNAIKAKIYNVGNSFKVLYYIDSKEYTVLDSTGNTKLFLTKRGAKKWCIEKYNFSFK